MTNDTNSKRPTHRAYHEVKKDGRTIRSIEVGAIWPNRNGNGFSLKLDYVPVGFTGWLDIRPSDEPTEGAA